MNKKGFTLVELLAVIVILSILIIVVATRGFSALNKAKENLSIIEEKSILEGAKVLGSELANCDNDKDFFKKLNDNSITEAENCNELNFNNSCVDVPLSFLIDEQYIAGKNLKKYGDDYNVYLCNRNNNLKALLSPFKIGTFSDKVLKSTLNNNMTEYLATPITTPGKESTTKLSKADDPEVFNSTQNRPTNYYIAYADDYTVNPINGSLSLVNPTLPTSKYTTDDASNLVGKYTVWKTSLMDINFTQNKDRIYKISTNISDVSSTIKYATINSNSIIKTSAESTLSKSVDDLGVSYYYRGEVNDNYINFAGICWRIVRIEGDGSVKLILEDKDYECNSQFYTGDWGIGNYIKFGYDENSRRVNFLNYNLGLANQLKVYQNVLSQKIDDIYMGEISEYLKNDSWCYDNTFENDNYGAYIRLYINKKPSFKCLGMKIQKFSDNSKMYVGALTIDEVSFAGGTFIDNQNYYLVNNYSTNYSNSLNWLTLSPSYHDDIDNYDYSYHVGKNGNIYSFRVDIPEDETKLRPSITLKNDISISGSGTKDNPYYVN